MSRRFKAGDPVRLKHGRDCPPLILKRFGQYGDDVECVWFNRHSDGLGNVTYTGNAMWLSEQSLEPDTAES